MGGRYRQVPASISGLLSEADIREADLFYEELIGRSASRNAGRTWQTSGSRVVDEADLFYEELTGRSAEAWRDRRNGDERYSQMG